MSPYITQGERALVDDGASPQTAGQLNYKLTCVIRDYLVEHGVSYQTLSDCNSALDMAKTEFYRRVVAPYEDKKRRLNSDVYL